MTFQVIRHADRGTGIRVMASGLTMEQAEDKVVYYQSFLPHNKWEDRYTIEDETPMNFEDIAKQQGWNNDSLLTILRSFVAEKGLSEDLAEYAQEIAENENGV